MVWKYCRIDIAATSWWCDFLAQTRSWGKSTVYGLILFLEPRRKDWEVSWSVLNDRSCASLSEELEGPPPSCRVPSCPSFCLTNDLVIWCLDMCNEETCLIHIGKGVRTKATWQWRNLYLFASRCCKVTDGWELWKEDAIYVRLSAIF